MTGAWKISFDADWMECAYGSFVPSPCLNALALLCHWKKIIDDTDTMQDFSRLSSLYLTSCSKNTRNSLLQKEEIVCICYHFHTEWGQHTCCGSGSFLLPTTDSSIWFWEQSPAGCRSREKWWWTAAQCTEGPCDSTDYKWYDLDLQRRLRLSDIGQSVNKSKIRTLKSVAGSFPADEADCSTWRMRPFSFLILAVQRKILKLPHTSTDQGQTEVICCCQDLPFPSGTLYCHPSLYSCWCSLVI